MNEDVIHKDGIYFDLPEAEYLADPALGYTDMKTLARSPADYWWFSPMNEDRPVEEETETKKNGKLFGSALHKMLLEGTALYESAYFVMPEDPEGMLRTKEDLSRWLDERNIRHKKTEKKDALIDLVLQAPLCDVEIENVWREKVKEDAGDRTVISNKWDHSIRLMSEIVKRHPQLQNAFVGGAPEVTVFWTEDGVRRRNRYDYLKPHGLFDLKSLSNWQSAEYRTACVNEMRRRDYGVQVAHYLDGRAKLIDFIERGLVYGNKPEHDTLLREIVKAGDAYEFVFVFMQTIGSPRALPIRFPQGGTVHGKFQQKIEEAIAVYRQYYDRFGEAMWVEVDEMWSPSDEDLAPLMWS